MEEHFMYARFWRCALQVNPFSYHAAYRGADLAVDEAAYNQALLEQCRETGVNVIGVADHGSVAAVDALRQALTPHGIVVFPGFEIAASDKTHFVCLFDENTSVQSLERYLGNLDLLDPEERILPSRLGSIQLINKIEELGGFIYAAHCTQDSGLLKHRLQHVWKHPALRAAQIPHSVEALEGEDGDFYRRVLLGRDAAYRRERPMALINAKDVAKPEDLGKANATCLIKMTRPTFSAFKVAFLDPESRIRLNSTQVKSPIGRLLSLTVTGGYLDGVKINFSDHLNTVIGGRGTGKSTLLECVRYVLDCAPKGIQARKLHTEIIKENLSREGGRIELSLVSSSQNGRGYTVSRRYGEPPVVRDEHGDVSTMSPADLMPAIDIFGQNEIYELAQDPSSRIQLLERFLPQEGEYRHKLSNVQGRLKANQQKVSKALADIDDLSSQVDRLPNLEEQLRGFEDLGVKDKLAKTSLLAREREMAKSAKQALKQVETAIPTFVSHFPELSFINDEALKGVPDIDVLLTMRASLEKLTEDCAVHLKAMQSLVDEAVQSFDAAHRNWEQLVKGHDTELEKELRALPDMAGKSGQEIGAAYQRLQQDIEGIKPLKTKLPTHQGQLDDLRQERRNLLAELSDLRAEHIGALIGAAKQMSRRLKKKLKIEIVPDADRTPIRDFLLACKLENVGERRLAWIEEATGLSPSALVKSIAAGPGVVCLEWGATPLVAEALTKLQPSQIMEMEALDLEHRVDISLNVAHDDVEPVFKPLTKLSTGQQCTAILHMLLLDNPDPLLMDQPEDNLDNAFIADRIVAELRDAKTSRQFLFATHNANIPVFGDAEWIGVFTAEENRGSLTMEAQGSIDVPVIRDQVAKILEGGRAAFIQRKEKYEF
ncbi:TrlF family AAA-like ATPase [Pseudomonas sp. CGJS7]|uniref:TrlF family AAA-like ATPase n=1 Tax=Pseudomonas sp. CGJS7 TaxID=3109348 RepID=UPI00300BC4DA